MNKKVDQLSLPSDLYSRNVHIAEGIRQYKKLKGLRRIKILDVGGRGGQLNVFLDPEDHLTILDIREGGESNLIVGDGTQMTMFEDHSFDVVVSGDTYEHIPFDLRKAFILESFRVSADLVILAAPFDEPGVHEAETMLNHFFQSLLGEDHEWLKEHLEYGLPEKALLEDLIRSHGRQFFILSSSDLDNWVLLQMLIFFSYCYGVSDDLIQAFYQAYNRDFLEVEDFRLGSYRQ
ncbi:MAG: class I SAM-dependent methyltransferase, partial [Candidatus Gracilibacteria bacterium]|nr:class I SAM-dependent methyltransferase [Candidatus Gracilibacteria bacterium]